MKNTDDTLLCRLRGSLCAKRLRVAKRICFQFYLLSHFQIKLELIVSCNVIYQKGADFLEKQGSVLDEDEEPEQYSNDVPTKLRTLNNMVNQYLEEGRAETCVPLCKKAYADIQKELGENHPDLATVMCILAKVYR